jgi:hypothetical protein
MRCDGDHVDTDKVIGVSLGCRGVGWRARGTPPPLQRRILFLPSAFGLQPSAYFSFALAAVIGSVTNPTCSAPARCNNTMPCTTLP